MGKVFVQYFEQLFSSSGSSEMEECLSAVHARKSPEMNEKLAAIFSSDEVDQALDQMHLLKSPGQTISASVFIRRIGLLVELRLGRWCWIS
jgi:hypothetical protein